MAATIISRGFGALSRLVTRGFFSGAAPSPDCFLAFNGKITGSEGFEGLINDDPVAVIGLINDDPVAVLGTVFPEMAFNGLIDDSPTASQGKVTGAEGFDGEVCDC